MINKQKNWMMHNRHDDIFSYLLGPHLWCLGCDKPYESVNQAPTVTGLQCPCHSFNKAGIIKRAWLTGRGFSYGV